MLYLPQASDNVEQQSEISDARVDVFPLELFAIVDQAFTFDLNEPHWDFADHRSAFGQGSA